MDDFPTDIISMAERLHEIDTAHNVEMVTSIFQHLAHEFVSLDPNGIWTNAGLADFFSELVIEHRNGTGCQESHTILD